MGGGNGTGVQGLRWQRYLAPGGHPPPRRPTHRRFCFKDQCVTAPPQNSPPSRTSLRRHRQTPAGIPGGGGVSARRRRRRHFSPGAPRAAPRGRAGATRWPRPCEEPPASALAPAALPLPAWGPRAAREPEPGGGGGGCASVRPSQK